MTPSLPMTFLPGPPEALTVLLDGCVVGCIASSEVEKVVAHIRQLKVSSASVVRFWSKVLASFPKYYLLLTQN